MRYSWLMIPLAALVPQAARAQGTGDRFEIGGHVAIVRSGEFDATDAGVGGRVGWRASSWLGVEGEFTLYPGDFADDRAPFSSARIEGLFGATIGPRLGRVRPFARLRPGFLIFREPSEPAACILIFPPPLACLLPGRTQSVLDVGGGIELSLTPRAFVRIDVGDRAVRYPGPSFDRQGEVHEDDFFRHDLRVAFSAGVTF